MSNKKILGGICPFCKQSLSLDDNDRLYKSAICPICNHFIRIDELGDLNQINSDDESSSQKEQVINYISKDYRTKYKKDGSVSGFYCYINHSGLNLTKKVYADSNYLLDEKIENQVEYLERKWREFERDSKAKTFTRNIQEDLQHHERLLKYGLDNTPSLEIETLKDSKKFDLKKPTIDLREPELGDALPRPSFLEKIFKKYAEKRSLKREEYLQQSKKAYKTAKKIYKENLQSWKEEKDKYYKKQEKQNRQIDNMKKLYEKGDERGVEFFYAELLKKAEYPAKFPKNFDLQYDKDKKTLLVEYELPDITNIPQFKEQRYTRTTDRLEKIPLTQAARERLYDKILYMVALRVLHDIFSNDEFEHIENVGLNGFVNTLDKSRGKKHIVCILSLFVKKEDFNEIDLSSVDPKACFKGLKGVASAKLSQLAPIPPILKINKKDRRFREGKDINVDDSVNLAAMDWEDFEHLVRSVFEEEFAELGMEVKVTQSSRDLGVDAIAFDPDPIRGGKIIIQAKRYTNTVKVESVRALYGIMQDEGAMKGIIVTTSDYGPDAYNFAKNKPITLVNGNNLLAMLEKYGHRSKIDLKEAKRLSRLEE